MPYLHIGFAVLIFIYNKLITRGKN
uniref:Uncharacterized protein n=1 Tax=Arundo donax TaxID=35708 RepID=A0A0A8Z7M8_ARUDO